MKETLDACPVCHSKLIAPHNQVGSSPRRAVEEEVLAVITTYARCMSCGVVFQNPRMNANSLQEYYISGKYRADLNQDQKALDDDEKERASRIYRFVYDRVTHSHAPASHLDIGSSRGYLLKEVGAPKRVGVDLFPEYCQYKDIEMFKSIDEVKGRFELVTCIHELEHELDPVGSLKKIKDRMKKDGVLIVEVPSASSPGGPLRLAHTFYFEPWALAGTLRQAGLEMVGVAITPHILVTAKRS